MNPDHLIELADQILQVGPGCPRQATVNRAISTACHVLFHALAGGYVARTVGSLRTPRYWEIVTPIHRSIDHGTARKMFEKLARDRVARADLKRLASSFLDRQSAHNAADYDPAGRYSRQEARDFVDRSREAIKPLRAMSKADRLILVVQFISKLR